MNRRPIGRRVPTFPEQFVKYALEIGAIRLEYRGLREGPLSPYFFYPRVFYSRKSVERLASAYAHTIWKKFREDEGFVFDTLYGSHGPSYLLSVVAMKLGARVGEHPPRYAVPIRPGNHVLIIDDDSTDYGMARESVEFIKKERGGEVVGLVIPLDRQERAVDSNFSEAQEFEKQYAVPVVAIATVEDLIAVLKRKGDQDDALEKIRAYKKMYGV